MMVGLYGGWGLLASKALGLAEVESPDNLIRLSGQLQAVQARVVIGLGRPVNDAHMNNQGRESGPMRAIRRLQQTTLKSCFS